VTVDFKAEFERFAVGLVGASPEESVVTECPSAGASRALRSASSAHCIYDHALELVDREGIDALTFRRLAAELEISTRTLYKRIGSRSTMIRELIDYDWTRLSLDFQPSGTWEESVWLWCLQLHQVLTARPHLTLMSQGHTLAAIASYVDAFVEATVDEGIPQHVSVDCGWSLADLTINDAVGAAREMTHRSAPHAAWSSIELSKTTADAIKWIMRGVRTETESIVSRRNG
jgi:AcrR family transcriptional regulator